MSRTFAPLSYRFPSLLLLLLTLAPVALIAQQQESPTQPYVFRTTTRIVLLDIVVTDKQGKVVTNLKESDFSVYDNGSSQRIRSFEAPATHIMPKGTGMVVRSTADLARIGSAPVTMLVLDEVNNSF